MAKCGTYDGLEQRCDTYGGNTRTNVAHANVEYWKCSDYANELFSQLNNPNIADSSLSCNNHASGTETWTYLTNGDTHSPGYRNKNDNIIDSNTIQILNQNIKTKNFVSADWINTLQNVISNEINDRKQNYLYSNALYVPSCQTSSMIAIGNIIIQIRDSLNALSNNVDVDIGADLQPIKSLIPQSKNINTNVNTPIVGSPFRKMYYDYVNMYHDCICYSDCGGYAVCFCYGNCNYY